MRRERGRRMKMWVTAKAKKIKPPTVGLEQWYRLLKGKKEWLVAIRAWVVLLLWLKNEIRNLYSISVRKSFCFFLTTTVFFYFPWL